jgi:type II secretory pathway pseudopilin PulG
MVEVLTVIAIIGTLTALLVPMAARAQDAAMRATCMAHLRQLGLGAVSHASEHKGVFPAALLYGTNDDCLSGDVRAWDWHRHANGSVTPGLLWSHVPGVNAHGVLHCPTAIAVDASWSGDPVTGYNYNTGFIAAEARMPHGGDAGSGAGDLVQPKANLDGDTHVPLARCRRSANTALFGMGGRRGGVNKFMRSPENVGTGYDLAYAGGQAFPNGSNWVGVDGSVWTSQLPHKGMHADALPVWIVDQLNFPRNGFLSDDASAYDPR